MTNNVKSYLRLQRRKLFEFFGISRYTPKPSLNDLDSKLEKYLNYKGGFFIEAGGNDGIKQSNTYYLEFGKRWRGLIVEAIPDLYRKCKNVRKRSIVCNKALVGPDYSASTLKLHYAGLMSVAEGAMPKTELKQHVDTGLTIQNIPRSYLVDVPAATLESILDETKIKPEVIDFLSLDIEGGELDALRGLNLNRYRPRYILVEARYYDEVNRFLVSQDYVQIEKMSHHDYLYGEHSNKSVRLTPTHCSKRRR